ncbi:hypothetical protein AGMMS4957_05500 [Bacteroidia bacterium]|nr:hypothetical protein AGMMS4957_05500 [Bacteroidia bacterium]
MKILILNTSERTGGAAIAANRLMHALNKSGHEAKMLVRDKQTADENVVSINTNWLKRKINFLRFAWERWVIFVHNRFSKKNLFAVSIANTGADISRHPLVKEADIIHIHWINQGFLSLKSIRQLTQLGKPIVWTMHDMWCFTHACHYAGDCRKYETLCNHCEMLRSNKVAQSALPLSSIHFVGCSRWLADRAGKSRLLRDADLTNIPNPIDVSVFHPVDKIAARQKFNLPANKQLILFAAAKLSDERKGIKYLVEACRRLNGRQTELVFLGGKIDEQLVQEIALNKHILGYLRKPEDIAMAYAACDVFVTPSIEDNLPNTIMESMACGTPCVGFNIGGIPEMLDHRKNGYVAKYKDANDFAFGIEWVLNNTAKWYLSDACLTKVKANYAESVVSEKYTSLYTSIAPPQKPPSFSIITVTYNAAQWLERTIRSIASQSCPAIEYLIIDGGSTDGTLKIIRQYESHVSYWLSEPDKGLYDAMNKGLQLATGDYVWFVNAGDTLPTTDILQEISLEMCAVSKKNVPLPDIIYGETMLIDAQGVSQGLRRLKAPERLTWKSFRMGMLVCHQSFIVKREIAPLYDLNYRLSADFDWCIQCLKRATAVHNTRRVLSNFLADGASSAQRRTSLRERYQIMCKYYGTISTQVRHLWFAIRFCTAKVFKGRV